MSSPFRSAFSFFFPELFGLILLVPMVALGSACALPSAVPGEEIAQASTSETKARDDVRVVVGESKLVIYAEARGPIDHALLGPKCAKNEDCDDGNACTRDVCDGESHRCTASLIDADGDGYASTTLGACGLDCADDDARVHPGQSAFFSTPYLRGDAASWDYDCDGSQTAETDRLAYCIGAATLEVSTCTCAAGWKDDMPSCGETSDWSTASSCGARTTEKRTLACR